MICYRFFMTLFYRDKLPIMRPSQGFGGFREKGYLFSEIWGEGGQLLMSLIYKAGLYYIYIYICDLVNKSLFYQAN